MAWPGLVRQYGRPIKGLAMPLRLERGAFFWLDAFFALGLCLLVTMIATAAVIRLPMFRRRYAGGGLAGHGTALAGQYAVSGRIRFGRAAGLFAGRLDAELGTLLKSDC